MIWLVSKKKKIKLIFFHRKRYSLARQRHKNTANIVMNIVFFVDRSEIFVFIKTETRPTGGRTTPCCFVTGMIITYNAQSVPGTFHRERRQNFYAFCKFV